ncbi:ABC transporter permease subunit, partial [Azospirillum brasilense]|nr:ABC transporter permease subunit [Azospirillum brasilense]
RRAHGEWRGGGCLIGFCVGGAGGVGVPLPFGRGSRGYADGAAARGQPFPPVAVLAVSVPVLGFGPAPALIALTLYGLLPIVENTVAGLESVPEPVREAARGMGMGPGALLWRVELPLAAPVILAGVRTAAVVNLGTAAIASTVGAKTLGLPIIVGLNGSNPAYVIQGAVIVAALAVVLDAGFDRLAARLTRWRPGAV